MSSSFFAMKKSQYSHNTNDYQSIRSLGGGGFGKVDLVNYHGQDLVLKRVQKPKPISEPSSSNAPSTIPRDSITSAEKSIRGNEDEFIQREIEAGRRLHHKGIAQVYDHFEDEECHYILMEYIKGGDLFSVMDQRSFEPLRETDAKRVFRQICKAVQYSHRQGIFHLDLKLENILVTTTGNNRIRSKIIDFGLCHIDDEHQYYNNRSNNSYNNSEDGLCTKWAGSPDYCCPEILIRRPYSPEKADVWSLGVILYILLFAELPFSRKERYRCLRKGIHPPIVWPKFCSSSAGVANTGNNNSDNSNNDDNNSNNSNNNIPSNCSAIDLISQMLQMDPEKRLSMEEVLNHRFLRTKLHQFSKKLLSSTSSSPSKNVINSSNNSSSNHSNSNSSNTSMNKSSNIDIIRRKFPVSSVDSFNSSPCSSLPGSPSIASAPPSRAY